MTEKPGCLGALFGMRPKPQQDFPYEAKSFFFSNAEASFYHTLKHTLGEQMIIFPHVALRDLVRVTDKRNYHKYFNQIDRKQIDYLLVDAKTLKPILVIELDDASHQREDRVVRDQFVEKVLAIAKIPLVRIPVKHAYDPNELRAAFKRAWETYS
jgi:hypothetical protein